ncbi:MAG: hypothetical protein P8R54_26260 [Myxococcota bacterium]|nr:hypothetical protein [Myxococcota bacterium]
MIALFISCNAVNTPEKSWTSEAALASTAALDGGETLAEAGYEQRRYAAPPFAEADTDGSGSLSPAELSALIRLQDPLTFDRSQPMGALSPEVWSRPFSEPALQRTLWELLAFLRAEVAAAAPSAALPDDATLAAAAATEDLYAAPVQAVLRTLKEGHEANGLTFPEGLLEAP